ncbi:MAG TPA: outer membrane lipoprotein carrier protein LolA [Prosthecobacter sp.]|nr:outer membrane lipoprotein carrier protein LolA [Prosthecobacter sp.]HRK14436.1 outer membrane lipoprotein carrier protein LolA [Prosthecobacter sp.]
MRLVCLFLLALLPAAAQQPAPKPLPPVLLQWAEAQKNLGDMEVPFVQTRTTPALKEPAVTPGRFWRFADGCFRWELGRPAATVLVHDSQEFRVRESADDEWRALDAEDPRWRMWSRFLSGRESSPEELRRHFLVDAEQQTADVTAVSLRPKAPFLRKHLRQLDLQISPQTSRLVQLRVLQGDGSTLLMTFDAPRPVNSADKALLLAR